MFFKQKITVIRMLYKDGRQLKTLAKVVSFRHHLFQPCADTPLVIRLMLLVQPR